MVWAIHVEIAGQRQADSFLLTAGEPGKPREVTVGRPPAKADTRPDVVVPEKSVSKVHAVLHVNTDNDGGDAAGRLIIADRSRFGTTVNGQKMALGGSQELVAGDVVQLAPRTFLIVQELPVVVAVHPGHPQLAAVREAAARAGARVTHVFDSGTTTQVLYDPGDVAWSALVQGVLRGVPLVGLDWLRGVASAGLLTNSLPSPPAVSELQLRPQHLNAARPPARVPLPPPVGCANHGLPLLLDGATFGYSAGWQDEGLAALLTELGGRVAERPQGSAGGPGPGGGGGVVALTEGGVSGGEGARGSAMRAEELLMAILTLDGSGVQQLVASEQRGAGAGAGALAASRSGRQAAAAAAPAAAPEPEPGPADSDMTQEAAEEEEEDEAGARRGEVVEQQPGLGPGPGQSQGLGVRSQGQAEPSPGLLPATGTNDPRDASARGPPPASSAREEAEAMQGLGVDGWLVAARRPEDATAQTTAATADGTASPPDVPHEDAPPPKRRRLTAAGARNGSQPSDGGAGNTAPAATGPAHSLNIFSRGAAAPPAPAPAAAAPVLVSPLPPTKHEPVEDAPWMTQHTQGGRGGAARRSGAGLRGSAPPPPAVAVKEEPAAAALGPAKGKGKAAKGAAAAAAGMDELGIVARGVKAEEATVPDVLDASAQVVLEADLFAPTPEQMLPPPRCRSGSAEPPYASSSYGGGGGGTYDGGSAAEAERNCLLPDFKQFRKQGGQLPPVAVRPLPVFLVDNFQRTEETEAFLRAEEERAANKRRADEMFKKAEMGSKKPPRAPRRG